MKQLIVNADDFGLSQKVNEGIIEAFKYGIVTNTTILVNMPHFKNAVNLAKENPKLGIGIHLNLTDGKPISKNLKTIIDKDGNFLPAKTFLKNLNKIDLKEVEKELEAQIKKFKKTGLKLTHIDGHKQIHTFPKIVDIVIKLAKKHDIKKMRLPDEKLISIKQVFSEQFKNKIIISYLSKKAKKKLKENHIMTTDHFYGILNTGMLTLPTLLKILEHVEEGVTEIMCHPGYYDKNIQSFLKKEREKELLTLTNHSVKKRVKLLNIKLINYNNLK